MTLWQAALLGVLQGLTEFLPVSSSGHLALAQMLIPGFEQPGVVFDATLHAGTAGAVLWFERRRIVNWIGSISGRRLLALLALGTIATVVVAFPLRRVAVAAFSQPLWVGFGLLLTGVIVATTRLLPGGSRDESTTTWRHALAIGLAQGLAIFPGLSRSGVTIAASLGTGLDRGWAARFSFLLSVPVIAAVTVGQIFERKAELVIAGNGFLIACTVGALAAGVTGYFALQLVIKTVSSRIFHRFAWYCIPLGLLVLVLTWAGR
jgi:undecaprenyl-diphosphatase